MHQKKQKIHRQTEGETKEAKETEEEEQRKGEVWKFVDVLSLFEKDTIVWLGVVVTQKNYGLLIFGHVCGPERVCPH